MHYNSTSHLCKIDFASSWITSNCYAEALVLSKLTSWVRPKSMISR